MAHLPPGRRTAPPALGPSAFVVLAALAVLAAVLAARAQAQGDGGAGLPPACPALAAGTRRLPVDPARVPVLLHIPKGGVAAGSRPPVIVVLGGVNQSGRAIASLTGYSALADRRHFLVAYPTARGARASWIFAPRPGQDDSDVAYLRSVIRYLTGPAVCADPARVGLTGMSNGGGMAARMACSAADLLAAAAPVAGGYSTLPDCRPARPLPILEVHGARDPVVPYDGRGPDRAGAVDTYVAGWRARDGCGVPPRVRRAPRAVTQSRWVCASGTIVENDRVDGVGHDWPGEASLRPFSTTVATWQFLSAFRNPTAAAAP